MTEPTPPSEPPALYGLLAEFADEHGLAVAVRRVREDGYARFDAFTPWPSEAVDDALAIKKTWVPFVFLVGGIVGGASIYALEYWINVWAYPLNVGGRPLHSWPAFVPPTFECTVLLSSIAGLIGLFLLCGLPRTHHPLFELPAFGRASEDAFFLCLEAADPRFDPAVARAFLHSLGAKEVWDVAE